MLLKNIINLGKNINFVINVNFVLEKQILIEVDIKNSFCISNDQKEEIIDKITKAIFCSSTGIFLSEQLDVELIFNFKH